MSQKFAQIIKKLKISANPLTIKGMTRFGISGNNMLGVKVPILRKMARKLGHNHQLALELWESGIHEARILASMIDEIKKVSEKQMDIWVKDFDSWDVCDQVCLNLFWQHRSAYKKAIKWTNAKNEFEKRAGFALIAVLAVKDKKANDSKFEEFLTVIERAPTDKRNFVKKAMNWALRQIGKRNKELNKKAIATEKKIQKTNSKIAKWIANNAIKELESDIVQNKLN